jgi:mpaB/rubber oxygenase-like protein
MTTTRPPVTQPEVPTSFRYFANRGSARGRQLVALLGRFTKGPLALPDEVATELGRDRAKADPLSDAFIEAAFDGGYVRNTRRLVDQALEHGIASVPDASPELVALFEHLDARPDWLDWDRVERGAQVARRYGLDAFYYYGLISLEGYRTEMIYKPLVLTGTYTGGSAFGRYLETCRFWLDTSEPGALRQGGAGRRTAVTIRVMHSMIRRKVGRHPEWDAERLGAPLSQNAQFGTISLSFLLTQHAKLIGYWPSDREVLDHMHFWRYIGYLMGVEPAFYPETVQDWWRLIYLMLNMDDPSDGPDSRMLSQSFVAAFGPTDRDDRDTRARKAAEQRLVLDWTRFFLTEETFTANELVPPPAWRRWRPLARLVPNLRDELGRRLLPGYARRVDQRKRAHRAAWLERHTAGRKARFSPVETLAR